MLNINEWNEKIGEYIRSEIQKRIQQNPGLKSDLAEAMYLAPSTFYKRLRGDTEFTVGEIAFLIRKFGLSFDSNVFDPGESIKIKLPGMISPVTSIEDYIYRLKELLSQVKLLPDAKIHYTTHEVPFFFYCIEPILGAFKLFMFANAVWGLKTFEDGANFDPSHYSDEALESIGDLWEQYAILDSSEVWNPNIWDNTIQQLLFMAEIKAFPDNSVPLMLLDKIDSILIKIEEMIISGAKKSAKARANAGAPIQVYNNRMIYSNNVIIVQNTFKPIIFIIHDNPNFFICEDENLIDYTLEWIKTLEKKSSKYFC